MRAFLTGRRTILVWLVLAALAVPIPGAAHACAVCGSGPGTPGDPLARGFYWGVLFLMATPFAIAGAFGGWLFYMYWRARNGRGAVAPPAKFRARLRASLRTFTWTQKESES